jgi:hypothetical protein
MRLLAVTRRGRSPRRERRFHTWCAGPVFAHRLAVVAAGVSNATVMRIAICCSDLDRNIAMRYSRTKLIVFTAIGARQWAKLARRASSDR